MASGSVATGSGVSDVGDVTCDVSRRDTILDFVCVLPIQANLLAPLRPFLRRVPSGVWTLGFLFLLSPYTGFFFGMESLDGTSTPAQQKVPQ